MTLILHIQDKKKLFNIYNITDLKVKSPLLFAESFQHTHTHTHKYTHTKVLTLI